MSAEMEEFEKRIKAAKNKRERVSQKRAEKLALYNAAKEKLEKLEEKAASQGFSLEELPSIIQNKKDDLEGKITVFETSLQEVEEKLSKYDN